jgi:DNA invertase Pin-like site-specific DNA recombinase
MRIEQYASDNNLTIDKWYEDSGSGAKPWSETMWADLLSNYTNANVIVTDFARFSRKGGRTFQLKSLCEERNITLYDLHTAAYPFQDTTVLYLHSMLAELELEKIKMRSKAGHNNRAKKGKGTGFGFKSDGEIEIKEYLLLLWIIEGRQRHKSFSHIARDLNVLKLSTRLHQPWTKMWVYKLYNSPKVQNIINYQLDLNKINTVCDYTNRLWRESPEEFNAVCKTFLEPILKETGFKLLSPRGTDSMTFNLDDYDYMQAFVSAPTKDFWREEE